MTETETVPIIKADGKVTEKDINNYRIRTKLALRIIYLNVESDF